MGLFFSVIHAEVDQLIVDSYPRPPSAVIIGCSSRCSVLLIFSTRHLSKVGNAVVRWIAVPVINLVWPHAMNERPNNPMQIEDESRVVVVQPNADAAAFCGQTSPDVQTSYLLAGIASVPHGPALESQEMRAWSFAPAQGARLRVVVKAFAKVGNRNKIAGSHHRVPVLDSVVRIGMTIEPVVPIRLGA